MSQSSNARSSKLPRLIALWLLALSLCWCSAGTVLWNGARAVCYHYISKHRQYNTDTIKLATHTLHHNPDVVWITKDELRYKGHMFDVRKLIHHKNGIISLIGHFDEKEDILFALLNILVDDDDHFGNEGSETSPLWEYTGLLPSTPHALSSLPCAIKLPVGTTAYAHYSKVYICPLVPPPNVAC